MGARTLIPAKLGGEKAGVCDTLRSTTYLTSGGITHGTRNTMSNQQSGIGNVRHEAAIRV